MVALELFEKTDHKTQWKYWKGQSMKILNSIKNIEGLQVCLEEYDHNRQGPQVVIYFVFRIFISVFLILTGPVKSESTSVASKNSVGVVKPNAGDKISIENNILFIYYTTTIILILFNLRKKEYGKFIRG